MIRLLIVDDDEIICQGVATCIDWNRHGVEVVGAVYDGELGLEKARELKPDVMLVDINMPFMNGLELADIVQQELPATKIILLTAYKEFSYAQRAIELQVFQYISKPFLNEDVLQAVLEAGRVLVAERAYRREIDENQDIIRQRYLSQIVTGATENQEKARWCGLRPMAYYCTAVLSAVSFTGPQGGEVATEALMAGEVALRLMLDEVRAALGDCPDTLFFTKGECVVLLFSGGEEDCQECAHELLEQVMLKLARFDTHFICAGLGRSYQGTGQIPLSYEEAKKALDYSYYFGNNSIICIGDVESKGANQAPFHTCRREILQAVREGDRDRALEGAAGLFDGVRQSREYSLAAVSFLAVELLVASFKATGDEELYTRFIEDGIQDFCSLQRVGNIGEIQSMVERGLGHLFDIRHGEQTSELEKLMERAVRFIDETYANPELSLKMVADHVHISTSYLCILFRHFKNTSYVSYLNSIRMENAKKLLRKSNSKTYEVAFKVGFNSSQYFASSFKKFTGQTPGEYRSNARD